MTSPHPITISVFDSLSGCESSGSHSSIDTTTTSTSSTKPFTCPSAGCNKTFRRRFTLKEHVKTHSGEKTFACTVRSCRKKFTTSGNLSRHKRTQHSWLDTPLPCLVDGCSCSFSSEIKLERHLTMVHFGASTHVCQAKSCGRAFSTAGNLRRHLRKHHSHQDEQDLNINTSHGKGKGLDHLPCTNSSSNSPTAAADTQLIEPIHSNNSVAAWRCYFDESQLTDQVALAYTDAELLETLVCLFDDE